MSAADEHRTIAEGFTARVLGVPAGRWQEPGPSVSYPEGPVLCRLGLVHIPAAGRTGSPAALRLRPWPGRG